MIFLVFAAIKTTKSSFDLNPKELKEYNDKIHDITKDKEEPKEEVEKKPEEDPDKKIFDLIQDPEKFAAKIKEHSENQQKQNGELSFFEKSLYNTFLALIKTEDGLNAFIKIFRSELALEANKSQDIINTKLKQDDFIIKDLVNYNLKKKGSGDQLVSCKSNIKVNYKIFNQSKEEVFSQNLEGDLNSLKEHKYLFSILYNGKVGDEAEFEFDKTKLIVLGVSNINISSEQIYTAKVKIISILNSKPAFHNYPIIIDSPTIPQKFYACDDQAILNLKIVDSNFKLLYDSYLEKNKQFIYTLGAKDISSFVFDELLIGKFQGGKRMAAVNGSDAQDLALLLGVHFEKNKMYLFIFDQYFQEYDKIGENKPEALMNKVKNLYQEYLAPDIQKAIGK